MWLYLPKKEQWTFEYGSSMAWLVEFTNALNVDLDFKKLDVTLNSLNLKQSLENTRLVNKIKDKLSIP